MDSPAGEARRERPEERVGAIVVAAGASRRMGGRDKVFIPLIGRPLVAYSLQLLNVCPQVDEIVLVVSPKNLERGRRLVHESHWSKVVDVCAGGRRRQDSVRIGIERLPRVEWIMVHDCARPCIDAAMIARGLAEARKCGAAVAAVAVKDTIKVVNREGVVEQTLSRDGLWAVQTPQVFRARLLREAHGRVHHDVTDDASMVEQAGGTVSVFPGSDDNIKVTTPEDLVLVETIMSRRGTKGTGACG